MTNILLTILLQSNASPGGGMGSWLPLVLIVVIFYVFMILPQMRKNKQQQKFRQELEKGDRIINIGGIHGKITKMDDTTITVEVEGGTEIKLERSSISMEATKALNPDKWKTDKKK